MADPSTWDTLGRTWDSGETWDGEEARKAKHMENTKAVIDFSGYSAPELGPVAHTIHDQMVLNAATFTAPTVTMAAFQTLITTYDTKLIARASRATADLMAFNVAREALDEALGVLGNYVNGIAKGDAMIVEKSGFPFYTTSRTTDTSPPAAPIDLRLRHGELSGSIVARYKADRHPSTNEVQVNLGDPNNAAGWQTKGMFQGGKAVMDGFTPGTLIWVRVRTVGLKGVMGAWSDPAEIRVL
jgi:hypothetical protein